MNRGIILSIVYSIILFTITIKANAFASQYTDTYPTRDGWQNNWSGGGVPYQGYLVGQNPIDIANQYLDILNSGGDSLCSDPTFGPCELDGIIQQSEERYLFDYKYLTAGRPHGSEGAEDGSQITPHYSYSCPDEEYSEYVEAGYDWRDSDDRCYKSADEPDCSCSQNAVNGSCVAREVKTAQSFYSADEKLLFTISDKNNQGKACYTRKNYESQFVQAATEIKNGYKNGWGGGWLTKDIYSESPQGVASQYVSLLNLRSGLCFIDDRGECALNNVFPHSSAEDYFQFNWIYQKTGADSPNYTIAPNIEYHCPDPEYNTYFDKYSDGYNRYDLCFKVETSSCSCDRDMVDGECQLREVDWSQANRTVDPNTNALLEISDANNQGLRCGRVFSDNDCAAESDIFNVPWAGNPINCGSGKKVQVESDYQSAVGSLGIQRVFQTEPDMSSDKSLKRVYTLPVASDVQLVKPAYKLANGNFWRFNIPTLYEPSPGLRVFVGSSGRSRRFLSGELASPRKGALTEVESGHVYRTIGGTEYHFDDNGNLTKKTFRNGQFQDFSFSGSNQLEITDNFGRKLIVSYMDGPSFFGKPLKLVTQVTDPAGNSINYDYDYRGVLTEVSYPDGDGGKVTRRYNYLTMSNGDVGLSSVIDEHGDTYAQWSYDTQSNQAILSQHSGGAEKVYITYGTVNEGVGTSTVRHYRTSYNKMTQTFQFKLFDGAIKPLSVTTQACSGCVVGQTQYQYDTNGYLSQITSPEGDITKFTYNLRGLLESKTEAFGTADERTVTTTWHSQYKLPLSVDEPQRLTTYTYDANGNLLSRSVKDQATNETRTVSYTYNSVGQVLTVDGPRTDVSDITTYEYETSGNLTKITNALGHETLITSHDAHGKPLSVADPNGTVTNLTYHPRGWLTSITTDGATTTYGYDKAGQLTSVTMANGVVLNYEYDAAHRLIAIEDASGNRIEYTLDNYGNRTRTDIKDSSGVIQSYAQQVFNDLGQLKQALGANSQVNEFDYDAEGKPVQSEDALDNPTSQQFDELDRLQKVVDPALGETEFDYDNQDRLTSVTDATGKTTSYQYNAFGDLLSMTSPDTGTTTMTYDNAGNVLTVTDARNIMASYSYDALNRVTSIDYSGTAEDITFSYDDTTNGNHGVGRLTQVTDESGSTSYHYDAKGQLVSETRVINGLNFTTGYQYDAAGLIKQVTYPSGRTVDYQRNNLGQVIAVTTTANGQTQTLANNISYLPFGPLTSMTYGNGKVLTQSYDQDYRLTSKHTTGLQQLSYGYTLRNNINSISDLLDSSKSQSFSYDALGRLTDASGDYGSQSYTFDPIGNRLSKTQDGVTDSYTYSSTSHQLQSVGVTALIYDAIGNTLTKGDLTFTYNQVGRLATASKTGINASYTYNAQGQRVKKLVTDGVSTVTTLYHYDQGGQLIAETDGQGNLLKEYLYLDGQRLATVESGSLYYIHTDHLGTPLALTDSNGTVQWKGSYDPYGNVTVEINNLDQNQRFPGQYADEETGLHYNYFRDYDPEIGRYIQSDPIGLNGGINTYGYVGGNPVNFVDPLGLDRWDIDYALYRAGKNPSYTKASVNGGHHFTEGMMTFFRGHYRNFRYFARSQGWMGSCEELKAAAEGLALQVAIDKIMSDKGLQSDANYAFWDTAVNNKSRTAGRLAPNVLLSSFTRGKFLGTLGNKGGALGAGYTASGISGLGSVAGDLRYFVETQGAGIAAEQLGKLIADGEVDIDPDKFNEWFTCGCEE